MCWLTQAQLVQFQIKLDGIAKLRVVKLLSGWAAEICCREAGPLWNFIVGFLWLPCSHYPIFHLLPYISCHGFPVRIHDEVGTSWISKVYLYKKPQKAPKQKKTLNISTLKTSFTEFLLWQAGVVAMSHSLCRGFNWFPLFFIFFSILKNNPMLFRYKVRNVSRGTFPSAFLPCLTPTGAKGSASGTSGIFRWTSAASSVV